MSVLGYVGQLVPAPTNLTYAELWAAHKVMRMPLSLDVQTIFSMDRSGGVRLVRNYLKACLLRASCKTVSGADEMHKQLCKAAVEGVCLSQAYLEDPRPPGWSEPAFCTSLRLALRGLGLGFDSKSQEIAALVLASRAPEVGSSRKSVQAAFYD